MVTTDKRGIDKDLDGAKLCPETSIHPLISRVNDFVNPPNSENTKDIESLS